MGVPALDDPSRVRTPVEIDAAAKQVVCEIVARRNRPEHFADVRRFSTHVGSVIETSWTLLRRAVL